jgi:hypothetical protein
MRYYLIPVAAVLFAACGGDGDAEPVSMQDELGCDSLSPAETEELYVQELHECERDGETTSVYTFASSGARDSWREIAEEFGTQVVAEGDTWLEVD